MVVIFYFRCVSELIFVNECVEVPERERASSFFYEEVEYKKPCDLQERAETLI